MAQTGKPPAAMLADYGALIAAGRVRLLDVEGAALVRWSASLGQLPAKAGLVRVAARRIGAIR